MSLVDVDSWITEYEACERLQRDIQSQIVQRDQQPINSQEYNRISGTVRVRLKQFANELEQLKIRLDGNKFSMNMTLEEAERRHRQIENLQSKYIQLQTQFTKVGTSLRDELLQANKQTLWEDDDDDDDEPALNPQKNLTAQDLQRQQTRILEDQNQGLDALSNIIARQKNIALRIGEEVETQNEIIDDIAVQLDNTDSRVNSETRFVGVVSRRDSTCGYWVVIISLFVAILVVALI